MISFLSSMFSLEKYRGVEEIYHLHNAIEEAAYTAFADKVIALEIPNDEINSDQSGEILSHIKCIAHRELYRRDGYWNSRKRLLTEAQIRYVIENYQHIVHDRDTKLTNATYYSLSDLLMAFDDHNTMVKTILFTSWFLQQAPVQDETHSHLEGVKEKVRFYGRLDEHLSFSLKRALETKKVFWDTYFPGMRVAGDPTSDEFVHITKVRHYLHAEIKRRSGIQISTLAGRSYTVRRDALRDPLSAILGENPVFKSEEGYNHVRRIDTITPPLLHEELTAFEFFQKYYPEIDLAKFEFV